MGHLDASVLTDKNLLATVASAISNNVEYVASRNEPAQPVRSSRRYSTMTFNLKLENLRRLVRQGFRLVFSVALVSARTVWMYFVAAIFWRVPTTVTARRKRLGDSLVLRQPIAHFIVVVAKGRPMRRRAVEWVSPELSGIDRQPRRHRSRPFSTGDRRGAPVFG
jgi:hypothetical protein